MPDSSAAALRTETIDLLRRRVSVRKYADRPVPPEMIDAVLGAAFRAPTSSNIQSYSVVVVRDRETLAKLSVVTRHQRHVAEAPVFLAFCADLTRITRAMEMNGHTLDNNNMEVGLVSSIDAALVGMSASLAAESLGLQGVMIGAVRNDATATAEILGLPQRVYCVFGMCLGFPGEAPPQKPRMAKEAMVHYERYGETRGAPSGAPDAGDPAAALAAYDAELAAHYRGTGRPTTDDSWTHDMDRKFHPPLRAGLRAQLRGRGFDFS
jgi:FMN reductase (NADPH)